MREIQDNFCFGLIYGLIAAGIIAVILNNIREAKIKAGKKNNALNTFPSKIQSEKTPSAIVSDSNWAAIKYRMWSITLAVIIIVMVGGALYIIATPQY